MLIRRKAIAARRDKKTMPVNDIALSDVVM